MPVWLLFFFFQAEDGIRYWSVTGVQTCALPIFASAQRRVAAWPRGPVVAREYDQRVAGDAQLFDLCDNPTDSRIEMCDHRAVEQVVACRFAFVKFQVLIRSRLIRLVRVVEPNVEEEWLSLFVESLDQAFGLGDLNLCQMLVRRLLRFVVAKQILAALAIEAAFPNQPVARLGLFVHRKIMIEAVLHRPRRVRRAVGDVALMQSAQMPFANVRRRIACLLQQLRQSDRVRWQEFFLRVSERACDSKPSRITSAQNARARRRTDSRS